MQQLNDVEKTKLVLLTKSKNLVNAASSQDWQAFTDLERSWQQELDAAQQKYGQALEPIRQQLLEDTKVVQEQLRTAQQQLSQELKATTQSAQAAKQYLK